MIVLMRPRATEADVSAVCQRIERFGLKPARWPGEERVVVGAIGDERVLAGAGLERLSMVQAVIPVLTPYRAVARAAQPEDTVVRLGAAELGGSRLALGLWAPELSAELSGWAEAAGAQLLAELPTPAPLSPYVVRGGPVESVADEGLALPCLRPFTEPGGGPVALIGARAEDPGLLDALGEAAVPVALVRAPTAPVEAILLAAERLWAAGGRELFFIEKAAEVEGRLSLDVSAIAFLKQESHLPVMAHPGPLFAGSGAAPLARAAVAVGADGLWLEPGAELGRAAFLAEVLALHRLAAAVGRPFMGEVKAYA